MLHDSRPWSAYPLNYTSHPRIESLSDAAFRVFHQMNDYSRIHRLDGLIPAQIATKRWRAKALAELVEGIDERPLVVLTEGGYFLRSYAEHQFTTSDEADLKEKRSRAGSMGGKAKQAASKVVASATQKEWQNVAESESELEIDKTTTDITPVDLLSTEIPARDELTTALESLGIKNPSRLNTAYGPVLGELLPLPYMIDLTAALLELSTNHVRHVEAYIEKACRDTPDTIRDVWATVVATSPLAIIGGIA